MKPFAESCEQNKHVIFDIIKHEFSSCETILEIGSGTGQHAVFFASQLLHLKWQPSEQPEYLAGIELWLADYPCNNISAPIALNVSKDWPATLFDGVFSANTVHFMGWPYVVSLFAGIGKTLKDDGIFCLYGPFNYNHQFTSVSNENFDQWLKSQDPTRGIRDFEDLNHLAETNNLKFKVEYDMPSNNKILVWQKSKNEA